MLLVMSKELLRLPVLGLGKLLWGSGFMKKAHWRLLLFVGLGIGLLICLICGTLKVIVADGIQSRNKKAHLLSRSDHEDIARACVPLLLKSDSMRVFSGDEKELPAVIRGLHAESVMCTQWVVEIEMHGGFDHFGYRLVNRNQSNSYAFYWYAEGVSPKLLLEFPKQSGISDSIIKK